MCQRFGQIVLMDESDFVAKLQWYCVDAACVIHAAVVDEVITAALSSCRTVSRATASQLTVQWNSSSHHRSSHSVVDGIEKVTRASYRVARSRGSSWKMHLFEPTSTILGWLGLCAPWLVSTPIALPAQLLFHALEIEFCWPCNVLKTTSATDW